jgi:hypothetical protein
MVVFLAILVVGLAYAWGKGDLEWIRQPTRWEVLRELVGLQTDR